MQAPSQGAGCGDETREIPPFLVKLLSMLADPEVQPYFSWGAMGDTIHVKDPLGFARQVLPKYFKHSNFASFVRQLNLYGFSKTSQDADHSEFRNRLFIKDRKDLLREIKRKNTDKEKVDVGKAKTEMESLFSEVGQLQSRHRTLEDAVSHLSRENEMLWTEVVRSRRHQEMMQQRLSKVVFFLVNAFKSVTVVQELQNQTQNKRARLMNGESSQRRSLDDPFDDSQIALAFQGRSLPTDEWSSMLQATSALPTEEWSNVLQELGVELEHARHNHGSAFSLNDLPTPQPNDGPSVQATQSIPASFHGNRSQSQSNNFRAHTVPPGFSEVPIYEEEKPSYHHGTNGGGVMPHPSPPQSNHASWLHSAPQHDTNNWDDHSLHQAQKACLQRIGDFEESLNMGASPESHSSGHSGQSGHSRHSSHHRQIQDLEQSPMIDPLLQALPDFEDTLSPLPLPP